MSGEWNCLSLEIVEGGIELLSPQFTVQCIHACACSLSHARTLACSHARSHARTHAHAHNFPQTGCVFSVDWQLWHLVGRLCDNVRDQCHVDRPWEQCHLPVSCHQWRTGRCSHWHCHLGSHVWVSTVTSMLFRHMTFVCFVFYCHES